MSAPPTLVDGVATAEIPASDRGLMYGDGLFETIAVCRGLPCLWNAHLARLRRGAQRLSIPLPDESLLRRECAEVAGPASRCVVRLTLTRGSGGRGYRPPRRPRPRRILSRYAWPEYPPRWRTEGVRADVCRTRLAHQPLLAGIKHLNRLEQVLARSEWDDSEQAEGLMCDVHGRVIGGTMTNLFVFHRARLATPSLAACGIQGTVRGLVLEHAGRFGLTVVERELGIQDIEGAEGLFLTNAVIGVWTVRLLGQRRYDVHRLPLEFLDWVRIAVHQPDPEA